MGRILSSERERERERKWKKQGKHCFFMVAFIVRVLSCGSHNFASFQRRGWHIRYEGR
jgi:hypothetical protein